MKILAWNHRGAGSSRFGRALRQYFRDYNPDIVIILEPRISGSQAARVMRRFRDFSKEKVDAQGFSGGIWLWWRPNAVTITCIRFHSQAIHGLVEWRDGTKSWLTAVYTHPTEAMRMELWSELRYISNNLSEAWIALEDFNEIALVEEKIGGEPINPMTCLKFSEVIDSCGLKDLGAVGPSFTWRGPQMGNHPRVYKGLDHALGNSSWCTLFPDASVWTLPLVKSNHHPILVTLKKLGSRDVTRRLFWFQSAWQHHLDFERSIGSCWQKHVSFRSSLEEFREEVKLWNKEFFGNAHGRKSRLLSRLGGIQRALERRFNSFLYNLEATLQEELERVLAEEEIL